MCIILYFFAVKRSTLHNWNVWIYQKTADEDNQHCGGNRTFCLLPIIIKAPDKTVLLN